MKMKSVVLTAALAFASLSLLSAKSYSITLDSTTKAGPLQLAAGEYSVQLEGTNAVFTKSDNGKKFAAPVKVENKNTKFDYTAVEMTRANGTQQMTAIELGGSKTVLEFGD